MSSDKPAELLGYGKGNHEVMSGKPSLHLIRQPLMRLVVLTVGTVSVSARLINDVILTALFTLVDHGSATLGAAADNGVYGLSVFRRHEIAKAFDILRGVFLEDFIYCRHGRLLSSGC